jgi:uncharacterized delta-60 repeat protein
VIRVSVSRVSKLSRFGFQNDNENLPPRLRGDGVTMEALERRILYAAGDLDAGFGDGGMVHQAVFAGVVNSGSDVLIDRQGRTLVGGMAARADGVLGLWIGRYNSDGTLDTTFGGGDGQIWRSDVRSTAVSIDLDANGNILASGFVGNYEETLYDWGVWRFHEDGTPDASFGDNGFVQSETAAGNVDYAGSVIALPDGRIMTVSNVMTPQEQNFICVARYLHDGSPDMTFDGDGQKWIALNDVSGTWAGDAMLLADGNVLITGTTITFAAGREVTAAEHLLVTIDADGSGAADIFARTRFDTYVSLVEAAIDSAGNVLVVGSRDGVGIVARYTAGGILDTTFGDDGMIEMPGRATEIAIDAQDNILVSFGFDKVQIARFHADGTPDATFGINGISEATMTNAEHLPVSDLAIDAQGKLLAVGMVHAPGVEGSMFLARFITDVAPAPAPTPATQQQQGRFSDVHPLGTVEEEKSPAFRAWADDLLDPDANKEELFAGLA